MPHGGSGEGPTPLQAVLGALCGCEAVTFRRTATELGLAYSALDFEAAFTIDIRGRQGNRSVRPHFQTVRVRAVVSTAEPLEKLAAAIDETEARCPVLNLLLDAKVDLPGWFTGISRVFPVTADVASLYGVMLGHRGVTGAWGTGGLVWVAVTAAAYLAAGLAVFWVLERITKARGTLAAY